MFVASPRVSKKHCFNPQIIIMTWLHYKIYIFSEKVKKRFLLTDPARNNYFGNYIFNSATSWRILNYVLKPIAPILYIV